MALRLTDLVVRGEIDNTRKNSVHGWLGLLGTDRPVILSLTGDCHPDLAGRRIRFETTRPPEVKVSPGDPDESEGQMLERLGLPGFALQQIGPTGDMTADRLVRVPECSTAEMLRRFELGEPPPTFWKRCLYLEWYSQNGRVVVEIPAPLIEFLDEAGEDPWDASQERPYTPGDAPPSVGLGVTRITRDEDGEPVIEEEVLFSDDEQEEPADEYGLMSGDLQRELDAQARETERAMRASAREDDAVDDPTMSEELRELELMDEVIEHGEGEPLINLFKGVMKLRPSESLDDREVETQLKAALGRMALFGIAMDICEHFTPRDAYRLLVEKYCREECFQPELLGTRWVQHFDTAESCDACQAQFERELDQRPPPSDPPPTGDDTPF